MMYIHVGTQPISTLPRSRLQPLNPNLISQNVLIEWFQEVNSSTTVNFLFTITNDNNKLTVFVGELTF